MRLKVSSVGIVGNARLTLSVSVALLFIESVTVPGTDTVAVLTRFPDALAESVVLAVKVALPPLSRLTVPLRLLPLPPAEQLEPAVAVQVHVPTVSEAGNVSVTVAPATLLGPELDT